MRSTFPLAVLMCAASSPAQTGTFTTFGTGCAPQGGTPCITANTALPFTVSIGAPSNFALLANTGISVRAICGVELYCRTGNSNAVNMNLWIYDSNGGKPGNPVRTTTMPVTGTAMWNRATFTTPLVLAANTEFFIVFDNRVVLHLPVMLNGTPGVHFWNGPPTWNGPFYGSYWNYKVLCCGSGTQLGISNTGVPTIGQTYSVDLASAPPSVNGWFAIGLQRANTDLSFMGATGCSLYTNLLFLGGIQADAAGKAVFPIPVPNNTSAIGFSYFTQYAVAAPGANPAGLLLTAGAENKVGR